ncbi:glycosyltransferase family 2 protein [Acetivibrio thermocellus]|nr:glycosyltransferase [Acetivibrio thermocellus]
MQKKDNRIKYLLNNGNKGPGAARNFGINNCNGKYIAFLDSDDQWLKNH